MGVPPHRMRVREPTQKRGQLAVRARPEHHVPMIGHETEGKETDRVTLHRLVHHLKERRVVSLLLKQGQSRHRTVQCMVNQTARRNSRPSWHGENLSEGPTKRKEMSCVPFSHPVGGSEHQSLGKLRHGQRFFVQTGAATRPCADYTMPRQSYVNVVTFPESPRRLRGLAPQQSYANVVTALLHFVAGY
jgi:hypothetical protein